MKRKPAAALLLSSGILFAQAKFEVASVKPSPDPAAMAASGQPPHRGIGIDAARVDMGSVSLLTLIGMAYKVEAYRVTGPNWMATERFDVLAKIPEGATKQQVPEMLQTLLAERFKLVAHRETSEEPVYALLVGTDGPKLKEAPSGDLTSARPFPNDAGGRVLLSISDHGSNGWQTYFMLNGSMVFEAPRITLPELALVLMRQVDLPVVDKTGLPGAYEVSLLVPGGPNARMAAGVSGRRGALDGASPSGEASVPTGVNIFKSVEKLGLQLERTKAPIEHLVVEHLEKIPTEN